MSRLIMECEKLTNINTTKSRKVLDNLAFLVSVPSSGTTLQLNVTGDKVIYSQSPIEPQTVGKIVEEETQQKNILNFTISLEKTRLNSLHSMCRKYIKRKNMHFNLYIFSAFSSDLNNFHPHTIFSFFNQTNVTNMHGTQVSLSQIQSQSLIKSFALAAAHAEELYGVSINFFTFIPFLHSFS